jgi:hypothetical protein
MLINQHEIADFFIGSRGAGKQPASGQTQIPNPALGDLRTHQCSPHNWLINVEDHVKGGGMANAAFFPNTDSKFWFSNLHSQNGHLLHFQRLALTDCALSGIAQGFRQNHVSTSAVIGQNKRSAFAVSLFPIDLI